MKCPVCKGEKCFKHCSKAGYTFYLCTTCNHLFLSPILPDAELKDLYKGDYQANTKEDKFNKGYPFPRSFKKHIAYLKKNKASGSVLDIGCSTGAFLWLAKQSGFKVQGVELNPETAKVAEKNGIPVTVGTTNDVKKERFEIIHLGDIIEHIPNANAFIQDTKKLLAKDGLLIIKTPNNNAFFPRATYSLSKIFPIPWSHVTPPHHVHQFSDQSLQVLLENNGFVIDDVLYGRASLLYELGATYLFRERKFSFAGLLALIIYPPLYLLGALSRKGSNVTYYATLKQS